MRLGGLPVAVRRRAMSLRDAADDGRVLVQVAQLDVDLPEGFERADLEGIGLDDHLEDLGGLRQLAPLLGGEGAWPGRMHDSHELGRPALTGLWADPAARLVR